jgi:cellulose synthase/poly-beta-1,6-N-acetylglucosamine synthase-like glycosyltransferase
MLLQKIWKSDKWKIRYMTDPAGAVETEPAPSVRAMFEQRKRWGSKTVHYSARQALFLGGIFLFYLSIFAAAAVAFFYPVLWLAAAGLLAIKFIGELLLLIPGTRIFKKTELRKFIAPASIVQLPLVIGAVVFGVFGKFKWKGQRFGRTMPAKKAEDTSYPRKHARKD